MRSALDATLVFLTPFALAGCASSAPSSAGTVELTRLGEAVEVTDNQMSTRECEYITEIPVRDPNPSDVDAIRSLRNEAGNLGVNLVLLVLQSPSTVGRAEGYLCAD